MTDRDRPTYDFPALLCRPEAFPWHPAAIDVIETHVSWVFLAGSFVVKLKKPVTFGFVDHSTPELRRRSCEDEVRLNRRLTADVYIDVVPITSGPAGLEVDGTGDSVEWATLMRRLPAERMLDKLIDRGSLPPNLAQRLASRLIPFHQATASSCIVESTGSVDGLIAIITDNLSELQSFSGDSLPAEQLSLVDHAMRQFIAASGQLFVERLRDGYVRDGHGDLRCEHICLEDDTIQVFDCVEFSPAIRCADIASDLAFLLMDLERLGCRGIALDLERAYRAGGVDLPPALVNFYRAHRALVRAKVDCLSRSLDHGERLEPLAHEARRYLDLATRSVTTIIPALIVMTGLSGTGKSTLAADIGAMLGATVIASDIVRKGLAGGAESGSGEWQSGIYSPDWSTRTYDRLFSLAEQLLRSGDPCILDAAFLSSDQRQSAAAIAARLGVPLILAETFCSEEIAMERIKKRRDEASGPSDASIDTYRHQIENVSLSPPLAPDGTFHVRIDTGRPKVEWIDPVLLVLRRLNVITPVVRDRE